MLRFFSKKIIIKNPYASKFVEIALTATSAPGAAARTLWRHLSDHRWFHVFGQTCITFPQKWEHFSPEKATLFSQKVAAFFNIWPESVFRFTNIFYGESPFFRRFFSRYFAGFFAFFGQTFSKLRSIFFKTWARISEKLSHPAPEGWAECRQSVGAPGSFHWPRLQQFRRISTTKLFIWKFVRFFSKIP